MRILIVEDERKTAAYLLKGLSENGYVVDAANRGDDGLHLALNHNYDLLILDVTLPERDGCIGLAPHRHDVRRGAAVWIGEAI